MEKLNKRMEVSGVTMLLSTLDISNKEVDVRIYRDDIDISDFEEWEQILLKSLTLRFLRQEPKTVTFSIKFIDKCKIKPYELVRRVMKRSLVFDDSIINIITFEVKSNSMTKTLDDILNISNAVCRRKSISKPIIKEFKITFDDIVIAKVSEGDDMEETL